MPSERISLLGNLRGLPRAAWMLYAGTFLNRFGTFVLPFLVLYLRRQGYSVAEAGLAAGAYGLGGLAAAGVGGHLADRLGRRNAVALSMFCSAVAMLGLSRAHGLGVIVPVVALVGFAAEAYRPAATALIADLVAPDARVTAYGVYRFAVNLGFALGPAVAGFLADRSFTYLFVGDAASSVAFGIVALAALPHGVRTVARAAEQGRGYRTVIRDRVFVLMLGGTLASAFVYMQVQSTFALHVRAVGLSNTDYGLLLAVNGLLIVAAELPLTGVTQRFRRPRVMAFGIALVGVGFALVDLAHSLPALAATVVVWTLGEMVSAPVTSAYVADLAPADLRGRYMGAQGMVWGLAAVLGPTLGTLLFGASPGSLWGLCGVLGLVGALLVLASGRRAAGRAPAPWEVP